MHSALAAELFKLKKRRMTYILLATLVLLVALFYFLLWLRAQQGPAPRFRGRTEYLALLDSMAFANVEAYGLQLVRLFGTLVAVIFAAMVAGNEYAWGTVSLVISRGTPRLPFIAAKMVVSVAYVLVVVTIGLLAAALASMLLSHLYDLPFGAIGTDRFRLALLAEGRTVLSMLPFVFLAIVVATVGRSAGLAVGFALGVFFLEGIFTRVFTNTTGWISYIPQVLPNAHINVLMLQNGPQASAALGFLGASDALAPGASAMRSAAILCLYATTFAVVAAWQVRRKDLVG